jgi:hypothetical protein
VPAEPNADRNAKADASYAADLKEIERMKKQFAAERKWQEISRVAFFVGGWITVLGVITGLIILIITHHSGSPSTSNPSAPSVASPSLDTSSPVDQLAAQTGDDVGAVQSALDVLSTSCTESTDRLANEVSTSINDLSANGRTESAVDFINSVQTSIPASAAPTDCAQEMAALLVLMETGTG